MVMNQLSTLKVYFHGYHGFRNYIDSMGSMGSIGINNKEQKVKTKALRGRRNGPALHAVIEVDYDKETRRWAKGKQKAKAL